MFQNFSLITLLLVALALFLTALEVGYRPGQRRRK